MTKSARSPNGSRHSASRKPRARSRRLVLQGIAAGAALAYAPRVLARQPVHIVVVGGGFAGASCARALRQANEALRVTLVEPDTSFIACPFSNAVIAGLRDLEAQQFGYAAMARAGVELAPRRAVAVDPQARRITLDDGATLDFTRLVLAPGIDLRFDALPGYTEAAAELMPHAWKAGTQTTLFRRQLEAMEDGGVVVISAPANPFRCPPGPYERASLIAHYLKTHKPRSKILLLDAKDAFSKQRLFEAAWQELYPGMIEWVSLSFGGRVTELDPATKTLVTEFGSHQADVANVIPPQRAGAIAALAGVADQTGWCPIDPVSFESTLQPGIHIIGDAAIAGAMPKSAFAANNQAKACAAVIAQLVRGETPRPQKLVNTCYSLVGPDYGISIAGIYQASDGVLAEIKGAGGASPQEAPASFREAEARYAESWFRTITGSVFG